MKAWEWIKQITRDTGLRLKIAATVTGASLTMAVALILQTFQVAFFSVLLTLMVALSAVGMTSVGVVALPFVFLGLLTVKADQLEPLLKELNTLATDMKRTLWEGRPRWEWVKPA